MKEPNPTSNYEPSSTGLQVLRLLQQQGATWVSLRRTLEKTDTGISHILNSLQGHGAVIRSECETGCRIKHDHQEGVYEITETGLSILARTDGLPITPEMLSGQQRRNFVKLWNKVRRLHDEVLKQKRPLGFTKQGELVHYDFPGPTSRDQIVFIAPVTLDLNHRSYKAFMVKYFDPQKFQVRLKESKDQTTPRVL